MTTPLGQRQIAFLLYENRSGSTLLAGLIDRHEQIGVTLETESFAELLETGATLGDERDLRRILDILYAEAKFRDWGVDRAALAAALSALPRPAGFDALMRTVLDLAFGHRDLACYLVKGTRLTHHIRRLRAAVPGARFVHIVRDPRAVFASQSRARGSATGARMNTDPHDAARRWAANLSRVDRARGPDLIELRYEDLLADSERSVTEILRFLSRPGLPPLGTPEPAGDASAARYLGRIPANQQHLHRRLGEAARTERIDAWRDELSAAEIALVQAGAGRMLQARGYAADAEATTRAGRRRVLGMRLRLGVATLARRLGNALRLARTGRLLWRLRVVFFRLRA